MFYRSRFQVRHSTVLVIVLLLVGGVLYEVTRTEPAPRQHAARTQDISLAAVQPVEHKIRPMVRPDYIGRASTAAATTRSGSAEGQVVVVAATPAGAAGTTMRSDVAARASSSATFGASRAPGRVRSSGSGGYASGSYGMGGVGAWGGASGMVRPTPTRAAAAPARAPKAPAAAKTPAPRRSGSSGSGGSTASASGVVGTQLLVDGFTTGAAAVQPGAVAAVQPTTPSPAASPAATPEPMSMLLMGSGLVALYGVRRRFQ